MNKMGAGPMGNAMQFGKSSAKVYIASETGIKFSDVAGEEEAKENLMEIVDFLHNPRSTKAIGAKMPKGVLLVGPPGTGKTLLAKAVAGEADVPFFSISGSEFVEMFVGMGANKVRDLFRQANEKAPLHRVHRRDRYHWQEAGRLRHGRERRAEQTLKPAPHRDGRLRGLQGCGDPGRDQPAGDPGPRPCCGPGGSTGGCPWSCRTCGGREDILKVHAKKVKLGDDVDLNAIARAASGASGAELANMINEAALRAVRQGRQYVNQSDLQESIEVVIAGYQKKNKILSDQERKIVSYHEIGHALVTALQSHSAPVAKITIIPGPPAPWGTPCRWSRRSGT